MYEEIALWVLKTMIIAIIEYSNLLINIGTTACKKSKTNE